MSTHASSSGAPSAPSWEFARPEHDADLNVVGDGESVRVVAMCTFEALQDYELGFRQYDVLTTVARAYEDPTWWVGQIGGKIGLFPSECVEVLKGDVERLPLFRIFLEEEEEEDDGDSNVIAGPQAGVHNAQEGHHDGREREEDEAQRSNPVKDVRKDVRVTEQASPELASSSSFSSGQISAVRQRASTHPEADVHVVVACYRCNKEVRVRRDQSFYPCECGANVKCPDGDDDDDDDESKDAELGSSKQRPRRNTTGGPTGREATAKKDTTTKKGRKQRKLEKKQRELKKRQEEEERKFREKRDGGRLTDSQWSRQVESARERLWRASLMVETIPTSSEMAAILESYGDLSSFSSASSGTSDRSRSGSLTSVSSDTNKQIKKKAREQKKQEKEEKKRIKQQRKSEKKEEKKRRNSLGNSSGSLFTTASRKKDELRQSTSSKQSKKEDKKMVKTKSGNMMTLEEIERVGKKSNWDVSRLFSVRITGRTKKRHEKLSRPGISFQRTKSSSSLLSSRSKGQAKHAGEREQLEKVARQLEEERKLFNEERQRFEQERIKLMISLAQEMEGIKMARDGKPMYPSPSTANPNYLSPTAPLPDASPTDAANEMTQQQQQQLMLIPTAPSPSPSIVASQSSFSSLPSAAAIMNMDACQNAVAAASPAPTPATSWSTPSLPVADAIYNPSLTSLPTPIRQVSGDIPSDGLDDTSPRKPPPRPPRPAARGSLSVGGHGHTDRQAAETATREGPSATCHLERSVDFASSGGETESDHGKESEFEEEGKEEWELSDSTASESLSGSDSSLEYIVSDQDDGSKEQQLSPAQVAKRDKLQKRQITVAPIVGISDLSDRNQEQQQESSWLSALSPRQSEQAQPNSPSDQNADPTLARVGAKVLQADKNVIVRAAGSPSVSSSSSSNVDDSYVTATKVKKVSFSASPVWLTADSPRRKLEALRAMGAPQEEINKESQRLAVHSHDGDKEKATLTDIDELLHKVKMLGTGSGSEDDSWGESSDEAELAGDTTRTGQGEAGARREVDIGRIPEWKRGPPRTLQEMKEYKEFVRLRYEAEKLATEQMLRTNAAGEPDNRSSWLV